MLISEISSAGAVPTLEAMVRFAGQRQRIIAHNVANISTPDFQPLDVSVAGFQGMLRKAVEARREVAGGAQGRLELRDTPEVRVGAGGSFRLMPGSHRGGMLFQDRNTRDLERLMQDVAENTAAFRVASDLLRQQTGMLRAAMGERVG